MQRYFPSPGGANVYARGVCEFLAARGHQLTVVTTDGVQGKERYRPLEETRGGVRIVRVPERGVSSRIARYARRPLHLLSGGADYALTKPVAYLLRDRIEAQRPDLVIALPVPRSSVVAAAACVRTGIPGGVVPFYHAEDPTLVKNESRWIDCLRAFGTVLATTRAEEAFLVGRGIARERIERPGMWVNPVPAMTSEQVAEWRRNRGITGRFLVVSAAIGDFHRKGIVTLTRAAAELPDIALLILVGTERTRRALAETSQLCPNVTIAGFVTDEEKALAFHAADLFAMPSHVDSFGIVYIEANSAGTPALAVDSPTMREVLGDGGLFVEFGDVTAVVRAIRTLESDAEMRARVSRLARENAERFAPAAALERISRTLERAAGHGVDAGVP